MTISHNPYKKQRRNVQGDKMPSETSFVMRAQGDAIDNEEEEEWIMEGYASKYEWALGTGLIDFEDYADEGYPTPPREDDEQPDDKDKREKGGEKGEERCARNHMATGMGDLPKGRSLEIPENA